MGALAVLLGITLLAASSPAVQPAQRVATRPTAPAPAMEPAGKPASSSMLRQSGYAIAKDKLD